MGKFGLAQNSQLTNLYNRNLYGQPQKGGNMKFSSYEVLHLYELKKVEVKLDDKIISCRSEIADHFSVTVPDFYSNYLVYKDLKHKGFAVGVSSGDILFFRVYQIGNNKKELGAKFYVYPLNEGNAIIVHKLRALIKISQNREKKLVIGMVDVVGDVSYIKVKDYDILNISNRVNL